MPLSAEAMEIIRTIRSSGDTLLRVISDVLDFARIEAGNLELEIAPFEIRRCILESMRLFQGVGAQKGLRLSCQLAPDEWVDGDGSRLRQVVLNLVSNAVKSPIPERWLSPPKWCRKTRVAMRSRSR